jgi:hypothetical protein
LSGGRVMRHPLGACLHGGDIFMVGGKSNALFLVVFPAFLHPLRARCSHIVSGPCHNASDGGPCHKANAVTHAPWRSAAPGRAPRFVRYAICPTPCSLPHDSGLVRLPLPKPMWRMPRSTIPRSNLALLTVGAFFVNATRPSLSHMLPLSPPCCMLRGDPHRRVARPGSCHMPHINQRFAPFWPTHTVCGLFSTAPNMPSQPTRRNRANFTMWVANQSGLY